MFLLCWGGSPPAGRVLVTLILLVTISTDMGYITSYLTRFTPKPVSVSHLTKYEKIHGTPPRSTSTKTDNGAPIFMSLVEDTVRENQQWSKASTSLRVQRIKDMSLQKDILRDVTASELALRIEVLKKESTNSTEYPTPSTIDYENLITKLDDNLDLLKSRDLSIGCTDSLIKRITAVKEQLISKLGGDTSNVKNSGKESKEKSEAETAKGSDNDNYNDNDNDNDNDNGNDNYNHDNDNDNAASNENMLYSELQLRSSQIVGDSLENPVLDQLQKEQVVVDDIKAKVDERIRILVREDGSVDWEGAKASGKEVAKFGTELWERLNGKEEEEGLPSIPELLGQVQAKQPNTPVIHRLSNIVAQAKQDMGDAQKERDNLRSTLRKNRKAGKEMQQEDIKSLRQHDLRVKELEKRLKICTMNLDMEKICVYIQQEIESAIEPTDQRMFIAQVALIDKQITALTGGLDIENADVEMLSKVTSLVDDDELSLICKELTDMKSRLGLDTQLVKAMDWGSIGVYARETLNKIKIGLSFFSDGTELLVADLQYAWLLIRKAVKGYTLKPREVNSIRRTGKDLLTLVPFTIILIIPLSPVGHVLVFGFIQRFFPEFYPSCYTEQRLNLRRLFSDIRRKADEDILGTDSIQNALVLDWNPIANSLKVDLTPNKVAEWFNLNFTNKDKLK